MKKHWIAPKRNWKGIQFEKLRRKVDPQFNEVHDVLSKAYYEKTEFIWKGKNWGVLSKELFDKLHGLIFHLRGVNFHQENLKQAKEDQIPEDKYNNDYDKEGKLIGKKIDKTLAIIQTLKDEGIELEV